VGLNRIPVASGRSAAMRSSRSWHSPGSPATVTDQDVVGDQRRELCREIGLAPHSQRVRSACESAVDIELGRRAPSERSCELAIDAAIHRIA